MLFLTLAVLLQQKDPNPAVGRVSSQACLPPHVKALHPLSDCLDDHLLGLLKLLLKIGDQQNGVSDFNKWQKGSINSFMVNA